MTNNSKDEVDIQDMYVKDAFLSKEEFIKKHNVNLNGLSSNTAQKNLLNFGPNEVRQAKPKKWYNFFMESLFTPFNCILIGIVAILIYTDIYLPENPSFANIIVIAILVSASTALDFFEEYRSNKAAEKLKELVATTTTVIRDGKEIQVPIKDITIRRYYRSFCSEV